MENISLPASLTKLGSGVFTNNTALTSIVVPSGIKELASNTFNGCAGLRSVTLNEGLESIGSSAFKKCSSLVSVEIPNSVTELGLNAFYLCSNLETVKIGDGIKDIGGNSDYPLTFGSCTSLKSITLGVNVTSVNKAAFSGCDKLSEINIDEANPSLSSKGNCIIQRSTNTIIWGFKNTDIAESGAIAIGSSAFYQCAGLTEITIPASIREIGEQAFYGCEDLELLVLECNTAESAKNSSIGFQAFYGCTALKEIRVGQYVSQVEFDYHSSDSKYNAYFGNCPSLQKLTVDEKNEYLYSVDNCIIERGTNQLVLGCKESVIPSDGSVAKIGSYAFYDRGLTKIEIPESVTTIGSSAFSGNRFTTLIIPETVRKIEMYAFNDCDIETLVFDPTVSFGIFAFSGNNIKTIYCLGTQDEWNALDEKLSTSPGIVGNEILLSAKVYIYSQNKPETEGNYWHWGEDNTPEVWETGVVA